MSRFEPMSRKPQNVRKLDVNIKIGATARRRQR
jgi:hypothetical protein